MKFWRRLWFRLRGVTTQDIDDAMLIAAATSDWTQLLWLCDTHLRKNPQAVAVVLVRARCYQAMNQQQAFKQEVALAYALDDTFVPAIYQHAAVMIEDKQIDQSLELLALVKDHPMVKDGVNSLLGNICMHRAQARLASEYQLRAWMGNFDGLRNANSYLFGLSYADVDEQTVACEHQFWAQTLLPLTQLTAEERLKAKADVVRKLSANSTSLSRVAPKSGQPLAYRLLGGTIRSTLSGIFSGLCWTRMTENALKFSSMTITLWKVLLMGKPKPSCRKPTTILERGT